jgi:hypothetical protein
VLHIFIDVLKCKRVTFIKIFKVIFPLFWVSFHLIWYYFWFPFKLKLLKETFQFGLTQFTLKIIWLTLNINICGIFVSIICLCLYSVLLLLIIKYFIKYLWRHEIFHKSVSRLHQKYSAQRDDIIDWTQSHSDHSKSTHKSNNFRYWVVSLFQKLNYTMNHNI